MINQSFAGKPKWFTFVQVTNSVWNPDGNGKSEPRFQSPASRHTLAVMYKSFTKNASEETINLRNVTGWKTIPNEQGYHIFGSETIEVYLSSGPIVVVKLHNQKGNPEVKLAKWDKTKKARGPYEKITIPQPELTQIDDFFDAMLAANLL